MIPILIDYMDLDLVIMNFRGLTQIHFRAFINQLTLQKSITHIICCGVMSNALSFIFRFLTCSLRQFHLFS